MSHNALPRILKFLRASNSLTQERLAEQLNVSTSLIAKFETARLIPMPDTAKAMDDLFGTGELIQETAAEVRKTTPPEWFRPWPDIEAEAESLRWFEPLLIPGLLQTEAYTRAVLVGGKLTEEETTETIAIRAVRQSATLDRVSPPMFTAIICEASLRRGAPDIAKGQLEHLLDVGHRTRVQILVIPETDELHAGLSGSLVIAGMPNGERIGYVDDQLRGRVTTDAAELTALERTWDALSGLALPLAQSRDLIMKVLDEHG